MSRKTHLSPPDKAASRGQNVLSPLVALLAHHDEQSALYLKDLFESVACDWRVIRVADGSEAARHVMNRGLPDLLLVCADLPKVNGADLIEWMRSFTQAHPIGMLVYGEPANIEEREQLLRHDAKFILPKDCPKTTLISHLTELVGYIEKRRFSQPVG